MAGRRGDGRRGERNSESDQTLTKEDDAIARLIRFNCPTKSTMFEGHEVQYFAGSKAIDTLYYSKYGQKAAAGESKFPTRYSAFKFLETLMDKGLFFRARKLVQKRKVTGDKTEKGDVKKSPKPTKRSGDSDASKDDKESEKEKQEDDKKKQKKVKLVEHTDQYFADSNDVYIWVFDPTPFYKKAIGLLIVIGTIVGCLFPLWPHWLRLGVYYLSIVGIGAFGVLIGVAVARTILFAVIWFVTLGKHKLWVLPNLTEDCGFFESFQPFYSYEYCPGKGEVKNTKKTDKKNKDKKDASETEDEKNNDSREEEDENSDENEENKEGKPDTSEENNVTGSDDEAVHQRRKASKGQEEDYVMVDN
ncbi:hypothetical protein L596_030888 [Steinernema carpocapsae]|uniref:Translocation protein SEC62 n=1 Tax=Steinernema carpocapsae TaxID=34508 RepID=A0A4V5ZWT1_STECR|nr:hypothetical protein L596_030888 [Steinernema carpocapsae]